MMQKEATHQRKLVNLNKQPFNILVCHTQGILAVLAVTEFKKISQPSELALTIWIQTEI